MVLSFIWSQADKLNNITPLRPTNATLYTLKIKDFALCGFFRKEFCCSSIFFCQCHVHCARCGVTGCLIRSRALLTSLAPQGDPATPGPGQPTCLGIYNNCRLHKCPPSGQGVEGLLLDLLHGTLPHPHLGELPHPQDQHRGADKGEGEELWRKTSKAFFQGDLLFYFSFDFFVEISPFDGRQSLNSAKISSQTPSF